MSCGQAKEQHPIGQTKKTNRESAYEEMENGGKELMTLKATSTFSIHVYQGKPQQCETSLSHQFQPLDQTKIKLLTAYIPQCKSIIGDYPVIY